MFSLNIYSVCPCKLLTQTLLPACRVCFWVEYCSIPGCWHKCNMRTRLLHWHQDFCVSQCAQCGWQFRQATKLHVFCCNQNTHGSPALEIPLSDSVTHSSFLRTSPWFCSLLSFRESHWKWATKTFLCDQFFSPTKYDWPFSSGPSQFLLTCFYFLSYS